MAVLGAKVEDDEECQHLTSLLLILLTDLLPAKQEDILEQKPHVGWIHIWVKTLSSFRMAIDDGSTAYKLITVRVIGC